MRLIQCLSNVILEDSIRAGTTKLVTASTHRLIELLRLGKTDTPALTKQPRRHIPGTIRSILMYTGN